MKIKIKGNYKIVVLIILTILALAILITSYQLSRKDNLSSEKSSALVINEDLIADFDYNSWYLNNTSYNPATLFGPWAFASYQDELFIGFGTGRPAELDGAAIAYYKETTSASSIELITNAQGTNPIREQGMHRINKHDNKLYIPGTDACCGQNNNLGSNYIVNIPDKSVTVSVMGDPQDVVSHVWGITVAPDGKMYSTTSSWDGLVFESIDNGQSWQKVYTIHSDESVTRAMDIKWFMDKIYLVTYEYNPANVNDIRSRKLLVSSDNARSWTQISNVIPRHLDRFIEYKDGLIIGSVDDSKLISVDSNGVATHSSPMGFQMESLYTANRYDTDGDYIYTIGLFNKIYRSNDLTNWELFASYTNAGSVFLSIHYWAHENSIIVGTRGGNIKILKYAIEDTPPQNQAPVVSSGIDQTITLPESASLVGTATDDGLPNPPATLTKTWSKVNGAGTVTFSAVNNLNTTASFSTSGAYTLRLLVSDGELTTTDDVIITVNPSPPAGTVTNPTFSPVAGTYTSAQTVTINTTTSGASIRYTLDNSEPNETSTLYSIPLTISTTTTVKAKAFKEGMNSSDISSATFVITETDPIQVANPTFSPVAGTYTTTQSVTISSATSGASIRYTINGSDPTPTTGIIYSGAVSISSTTTLKAIAYKEGMTPSSVSSATYTINTTPVITEYNVVGTISFRYENIPVTVTIKNGSTVVKTVTVNGITADNRIEFRLNSNEVGAGNYTVNIKPRYYTAREGSLTLGANQNVTFTVSGEYFAGKYTTTNPDKITILDISRFLAYFRASDHSKDLNGDGRINILDIVHMLNGYRATNQSP